MQKLLPVPNFIIVLLLLNIFKYEVCLLCLSKETSFIDIAVFLTLFFVKAVICNAEIVMGFDFIINLLIFFDLYLFIKKPKVPLFIP